MRYSVSRCILRCDPWIVLSKLGCLVTGLWPKNACAADTRSTVRLSPAPGETSIPRVVRCGLGCGEHRRGTARRRSRRPSGATPRQADHALAAEGVDLYGQRLLYDGLPIGVEAEWSIAFCTTWSAEGSPGSRKGFRRRRRASCTAEPRPSSPARVAIAEDEYDQGVCGSLVDDRRGSKGRCCSPVPNFDLLCAG